ncbi:MAG: acyloxyacyl hydrolase [Desulfuromonadales bacterium]|nr:acyloxyacyl hydrolase [Desulfuromonadales bacterium]
MKSYLFVALLVLLLPTASWSLGTTMELGVRGGIDSTTRHENYTVGELYYLQALPWQKQLGPNVTLSTRLDSGVGYLRTDVQDSGWLAVGGDIVFSLLDDVWELEGGFRPTWMFRHEIGEDDFGGPVQFSSHVGTTLNLGQFSLSYRYQHISNSDLYNENPGLDLHLIGLGIRF